MSPGSYARRGSGLTIFWAWVPSPFGDALLMCTQHGICGLGFGAEFGRTRTLDDMMCRWPDATYVEDASRIAPLGAGIFGDARHPARLHLMGGPFQIKVWEALCNIPDGAVTTYAEIAKHIGHPKAARAVGTAVGRNPISWLIPCHRALRRSGGLGGYHWGIPLKRAMLAEEAASHATQRSTRASA